MDGEISHGLADCMRRTGIDLRMPDSLESVDADTTLHVRFKSGTTLNVHTILAATGRCGNIAGLDLEKIGIQPNARGMIEVNSHYQTSVAHIYAVGDVIG